MNKSTKTVLVVIGLLSLLAGIFEYLNNDDPTRSLFGVFIGVSIIGTVFMMKKE